MLCAGAGAKGALIKEKDDDVPREKKKETLTDGHNSDHVQPAFAVVARPSPSHAPRFPSRTPTHTRTHISPP